MNGLLTILMLTFFVVMHEAGAILLQNFFDLVTGGDESSNDFFDALSFWGWSVSITLHTNDSEMIFLTDPHEEGLVVVVENTSGVGPVSSHAGSQEQGGVGFLEQVADGS